jgi:hypothetical protein
MMSGNETRRAQDAADRTTSREDSMETQSSQNIRIRAVGWANNTFWRIAVALAFAASLFSIYDNNVRVQRLERQVCDTVTEGDAALDELEYYRTRPDEKARARERNRVVLRRFHCPEPRSPVLEGLGATPIGIVEFGKSATSGPPRAR